MVAMLVIKDSPGSTLGKLSMIIKGWQVYSGKLQFFVQLFLSFHPLLFGFVVLTDYSSDIFCTKVH